jgi:flagellar assembly protein FliH
MTMSEAPYRSLRIADINLADKGFTPQARPGSKEDSFVSRDESCSPQAEPADPFQCGLAEGRRLAAEEFAHERQKLLALVASADSLQPEPSDELAVLIGEAVDLLVRQIVADVTIDAELLGRRAAQAAALVAECDAARTMWVHPDDYALLDGEWTVIPLKADPAAERGSIRIDCSAGWIEHGTALYLDQLRIDLGVAGELL